MAKKAEKDPDRDKNGIAYTKIQRRRMMKRVKCGLPPVPTQQEEMNGGEKGNWKNSMKKKNGQI